MIKKILIDSLFFLWCITGVFILTLCIALPLPIVHRDMPTWLIVLIPVAAFIECVTMRHVMKWFISKGVLN